VYSTVNAVYNRVICSSSVLNLGVITDSQLNTSGHVYQCVRQVRLSLTTDTTKTLVHAFTSSRLDCCNSLLYGVNDGMLEKLQTVQNDAARVTTETRKFDHIRPVLRELH